MFKNKNYLAFVLVGFICYFYRGVSITPAAQGCLKQEDSLAGVITLFDLVLTVFMVQPLLEKQEKEEAATKA